MSTEPDISQIKPASGRSVWRGADQQSSDWIVHLDADDCAELLGIAEALRERELPTVSRADFKLPRLARKLQAAGDELLDGAGFVLIRGLPVAELPREVTQMIYWGMGCHLGAAVSQSAAGDRLGLVYDRGTGDKERYYTRGGALEFHMDPVDVVGLLSVRTAKAGGASRIVSAGAVHNAILTERFDLLSILYRGFYNSRRGHGDSTSKAPVPVFAEGATGVECYFLPETIRQATQEGRNLTLEQIEALDYLGETCDRPGLFLDMDFRVGDIQFLNNRKIFHSRTDYVDYPERERKRLLLRLWLMMPQWPARHPAMNFHETVDAAGGGVSARVA